MTRRPMDGARKNNGDTAEHERRGVRPATDYGADEGEPIYAPFAGRVGGWWSGTGGNTVQVVGAGVTFVGQHLSLRTVPIGAYVNEGDLIGYTGSTGSATDGPHLHWWIELNGTRISGEEYMYRVGLGYTPVGSRTPNTSAAGGGGTSIEEPEKEEEEEMKPLLIGIKNGNATAQWALVSADLKTFVPIWTVDSANGYSTMFGTLQYVNKSEWNGFRVAAGLAPDKNVG